jgi:hypothetical protein
MCLLYIVKFAERTIVYQQRDEFGYYLFQQQCDLVALEQGMPAIGAHLMMIKGNPLMPRLNKAIKENQLRLARIVAKYESLARSYDRCPNRETFSVMRKFLTTLDLISG